MGEGIALAIPEAGRDVAPESPQVPPFTPLGPAQWAEVDERVARYLQSMGVRGAVEIERLTAQVRLGLESRAAATPLEDPLESAIEETMALLDQWLVAELGLGADLGDLPAARAAVLGGAIPGWGARWAGLGERSLADEIRARSVTPVPDPAPLPMEPSTIELCCHRLGCRMIDALARVFCRPQARGEGR